MVEEAEWLIPDATCARTGIREGDVLLGKYRIEWLLGLGGMGAVFAATHLQLEARVALKVLLPEALQVPEAVRRFEQEARAAARIQSDHVVRVTDVGQLPDNAPYMVMEHLEGSDLAGVLEDHGPIAPEVVVDYLAQACEGVAEAHRQGVIHRDLKPSNLFLSQRRNGKPLIKVLDFGISKLTRHESSGVRPTPNLRAIGTPSYMSPEQVQGMSEVDERTDLWALGVIAYELLVGRPPFDAKDAIALCKQVVDAPVVRLRQLRPSVPAALEAIVLKCLEKQPERRYQTALELQAALGRALEAPARSWLTHGRLALAAVVGVGSGLLVLALSERRPVTQSPPPPSVAPRASVALVVAAPAPSATASTSASARAPSANSSSDAPAPRRVHKQPMAGATSGSAKRVPSPHQRPPFAQLLRDRK
jgi:serine/threonine-protein kinase